MDSEYFNNYENKKNKLYLTKELEEKAVLIGIDNDKNLMDIENSLEELEELVTTAGATVVGKMIQKREGIHKAHYFGKGKIEELKNYIDEIGANCVVCDDEITASQMRNMSKILNVKILDRTLVILDIFSKRAKSVEGKVQVEIAQLKYKLSHLTGQGQALSRLGGGIGTRGPGEKKLETDRRNIANRVAELNKDLLNIEKHRTIIREKRKSSNIPIIAFVGYTNAGKSTLLNKISDADVLALNQLFATLDTTTRKVELNSGCNYLFTDTVGFIQKLPHNLIKAFKSTLEEAKFADILVHVVDASNKAINIQMDVVYKTLKELDCLEKPIITVFNKIDKENIEKPFPKDDIALKTIEISAKTGLGIDNLLKSVENIVKEFKKPIKVLIPYDKGSLINLIHGRCEIISNENRENGMFFEIFADEEIKNKLSSYFI